MSGTPFRDRWQPQERTLCTHRLFSLHGEYQRAVTNWVTDLKADLAKDPTTKYPRNIMLDSGAFTAWNKGHETTVDSVLRSYSSFLQSTEGLFDEVWMINLDKIPGSKGRDPTPDEIKEALVVSDKNYEILVKEFGDRILPVFHQGEDDARLFELCEMVADRSWYICVSPRNDLPERSRYLWSKSVHRLLDEKYPKCRTHGLATTGNTMIRDVPWYSIDSAAWVLHAGFGMVDIFHGDRYRNYFLSYEGDKHRRGEVHYDNVPPSIQREILDAVERYGFTLQEAQKEFRVRALICMGELARYTQWASGRKLSVDAQFGIFDIL